MTVHYVGVGADTDWQRLCEALWARLSHLAGAVPGTVVLGSPEEADRLADALRVYGVTVEIDGEGWLRIR